MHEAETLNIPLEAPESPSKPISTADHTATYPARLKALQALLSLSASGMADYMGVPITTYTSWAYGKRVPSACAVRLVEILETLLVLAPGIAHGLTPDNARTATQKPRPRKNSAAGTAGGTGRKRGRPAKAQ